MSTFAFSHIAQSLRDDISAGTYPVGSSLPPEREIGDRFGVSPGTARVALKELVAEGIVDGTRGRAKTVVRLPRRASSFEEFRSFAQWARMQGLNPGGQVVESRWLIASSLDEDILDVETGQRILSVVRVRTLDGKTVMLEHTHYTEWMGELVINVAEDAPSVTAVLAEDHGVHFSHAEHLFGAENAKDVEAGRLQVPTGTALLVHRRISRDSVGRPLEWSTDRYIAGHIMLSAGTSWHSSPMQWIIPDAEPWGS